MMSTIGELGSFLARESSAAGPAANPGTAGKPLPTAANEVALTP